MNAAHPMTNSQPVLGLAIPASMMPRTSMSMRSHHQVDTNHRCHPTHSHPVDSPIPNHLQMHWAQLGPQKPRSTRSSKTPSRRARARPPQTTVASSPAPPPTAPMAPDRNLLRCHLNVAATEPFLPLEPCSSDRGTVGGAGSVSHKPPMVPNGPLESAAHSASCAPRPLAAAAWLQLYPPGSKGPL